MSKWQDMRVKESSLIDWVMWSCVILRIDSGQAYIADKMTTCIKYRVYQHHTQDSETDWLTFASSHIK